jgi:8-oxo-dGTP pyrophosphatase MutT (NUDIX family)
MNFEPQKLFIGLMDFFSILLPGALLTYLLKDSVGPVVLGDLRDIGDSRAWMIFFFSSYLLGHFIFLIGSWLDEAYDVARRAVPPRLPHKRPADKLLWRIARFMLWLVFKRENNLAVDCATAIKRRYLAPLHAADAVNTFQWSKLRLAIDKPEALAPVQRFEADSKFFRSLFVVLLLIAAVSPDQVRAYPLVWLALLLMALWRYMEQRHKASSQAYWGVISLEGQQPAQAPVRSLTHAGGVVYRQKDDGSIEYLLVEATKTPGVWVLPKGHVESGEAPRETAVREVFEETGVFARIVTEVDDVSYPFGGRQVDARFYLMCAIAETPPAEPRQHAWHPLETALSTVAHEQNKALLAKADIRRTSARWPAPTMAPKS